MESWWQLIPQAGRTNRKRHVAVGCSGPVDVKLAAACGTSLSRTTNIPDEPAEVRWSTTLHNIVCCYKYLTIDTLLNRKPMQRAQHGRNVVTLARS